MYQPLVLSAQLLVSITFFLYNRDYSLIGQTNQNQVAIQINALIIQFKNMYCVPPVFQTCSRLEGYSAKTLEAYILAPDVSQV